MRLRVSPRLGALGGRALVGQGGQTGALGGGEILNPGTYNHSNNPNSNEPSASRLLRGGEGRAKPRGIHRPGRCMPLGFLIGSGELLRYAHGTLPKPEVEGEPLHNSYTQHDPLDVW